MVSGNKKAIRWLKVKGPIASRYEFLLRLFFTTGAERIIIYYLISFAKFHKNINCSSRALVVNKLTLDDVKIVR